MENQHRKIKGYRELSQQEIDLMNEIKQLGPVIEQVINKISNLNHSYDPYDPDEKDKDHPRPDQRWLSIGTTHLQQGLMALTRSIAKPDFF